MARTGKRAHLLLDRGCVLVRKRGRFTIRLKDRVGGQTRPLQVKIDRGGKTTGIAITRGEDGNNGTSGANPRYRAPRFDEGRILDGWLAVLSLRTIRNDDYDRAACRHAGKLWKCLGNRGERARFPLLAGCAGCSIAACVPTDSLAGARYVPLAVRSRC